MKNTEQAKNETPAKTEKPKVEKPKVEKVTRVKGLLPILIEGATKEEVTKKGEAFYKKHGFKTDDGCVLRHTLNILRDIRQERKGWWSTYKDVSKEDTLKIEKR